MMADNMQSIANQGSSPGFNGQFLLEINHVYMVDCQCAWPLVSKPSRSIVDTLWPKAFIINHVVRLTSMAWSPKVNKDTLHWQDIPTA